MTLHRTVALVPALCLLLLGFAVTGCGVLPRSGAGALEPAAGTPHVLLFVTTDCPIANGYAPTIQTLIGDYADAPVRFFLVHVDLDVTPEVAAAHARDYGLHGLAPVLIDQGHALVRAMGATITPEAVVLTDAGIAYRGRIDNLWGDLGKRRPRPTRHDLRDALDAVLDGRSVEVSRTEAIGCDIPDFW